MIGPGQPGELLYLVYLSFFGSASLLCEADYDVTPLTALVTITALPVGLDVLGSIGPIILELTYSPLGVAVFAAGVRFVYTDWFRTLQIVGEGEDLVLVLNSTKKPRLANRYAPSYRRPPRPLPRSDR